MGVISTVFDLALVVLGFGLIIVVHELGHFVAARWAGIRVMAFAVGFGPAAFSFRRGLGWRRGSSEPEYLRHVESAGGDRGAARPGGVVLSPTEYRLNWLPLGGYVKMLGQEDLNPSAVSAEADSYQRAAVWKRMVVISAGVVANLIGAAVLFIITFMVGLPTEPAVVGDAVPGLPASRAVATNAPGLEPGLRPGDRIVSIDGREPNSFNDIVLASAMARKNRAIEITVERDGEPTPLRFPVMPEVSRVSGLLEIGVEPPRTLRLWPFEHDARSAAILGQVGLEGVRGGMTLTTAGGRAVRTAADLRRVFDASGGADIPLEFTDEHGATLVRTVTPVPKLEEDLAVLPSGAVITVSHLLGLTPVLTVSGDQKDPPQGLEPGDIFARLGAVEYPSIAAGIAEVRAHAGRRIEVSVLRAGAVVDLRPTPRVTAKGTIGFNVGSTADESAMLALPPTELTPLGRAGDPYRPAAAGVIAIPGCRVISVGARPVDDFRSLRAALRAETAAEHAAGTGAAIDLTIAPPDPAGATRTVTIDADAAAVARLHTLGWSAPFHEPMFELEEFELKAGNPWQAAMMGVAETNRVMMLTYATFVRLVQGTVRVEHLKGPVGIAQAGTLIAGRGPVWLIFFFGLISINLAVVNFLPLPIVDGGQFLFLLAEQVRGKPAPVGFQNAVTMLGLVLLAGLFLVVTFNDVVNLFR